MLGYQVPDTVHDVGTDIVQVSSYIVAAVAAFTAILHSKSPIRKVVNWLVRRNVSEPITAKARALLETTVQPMIKAEAELTRAASKAQHDEQNVSIGAISDRVGVIEQHITRPRTERERRGDQ